jgi:hypothetical protein
MALTLSLFTTFSHGQGALPRAGSNLQGCGGSQLGAQVGDDQAGAAAGEGFGDSAPNAARRAGNQGYFVFEG